MALQSQIIAHLNQFARERVNLPHAAESDATARHQNTPTPNGNHRHSLAQLLQTGKGLVAASLPWWLPSFKRALRICNLDFAIFEAMVVHDQSHEAAAYPIPAQRSRTQ